MSRAAELAIADAGLKRAEIDGMLCGYSTVSPHIMLATVFAEHFGIRPCLRPRRAGRRRHRARHDHAGASSGRSRRGQDVLVVGGENRLTGQSRDASILALAQVGHPDYEVPLGPTIPGLLRPRRLALHARIWRDPGRPRRIRGADAKPCADPSRRPVPRAITVADVMASKPVALPLKLLDCCPVSDGGAAFVISREPTGIDRRPRARLRAGAYPSACHGSAGSERTRRRDRDRAREGKLGRRDLDVRYAAVYDSFTITLAMLLEDLGLAGRGEAAAQVRAGHFSRDGAMPLNTHGGLLSYGHCGVGGAMAHLVETHLQMTGRAGSAPGARRIDRAAAWRRRRVVLACQHVPGAGAMSGPTAACRLDHRRGSDRLSMLRGLRSTAIFPSQLLSRLRRAGPGGKARQRRGHGLRDLAGVPRRHAGDPRARSLQHRPGRYRGGLSHDGPWRQRSRHRRSGHGAVRAVRRAAGALFREDKMIGRSKRHAEAVRTDAKLQSDCLRACDPRRSSPMKHKAGDDEHRRHRQHLRKCFRGRPLGGFLHTGLPRCLPRLGHAHRCAESACDGHMFYSEHPATNFALDVSPHSANIDCFRVEQ